MKTLMKKTTLLALAVGFVALASTAAEAGCHRSRGYRPVYKRYYRKPICRKPVIVKKVVAKPALPFVPAGSAITVPGHGFGVVGGQAILDLGHARLQAKILEWTPVALKVQLPPLDLAAPAPAKLLVIRGDGTPLPAFAFKLVPAGFEIPAAPQGLPGQAAPAQDVPAQGIPAQGAPAQGAPAQGAPAQGIPAQAAPQGQPQAAPQGAPQQAVPQDGAAAAINGIQIQ